MKTQILSVLSIALFAASAFASSQSSKIIGTWVSECEEMENASYQSMVIFFDGAQMSSTDLNYVGAGCQGRPSEYTALAPYKIVSENESSVVVTISPNGTEEGAAVELTSEFVFPSATAAKAKVVGAKIIAGGQPVALPSEEVAKMPEVSFTKL